MCLSTRGRRADCEWLHSKEEMRDDDHTPRQEAKISGSWKPFVTCFSAFSVMYYLSIASVAFATSQIVVAHPVDGSIDRTLRFGADGNFQLTIFNDLHYGEAEDLWWGPAQDANSTRVINTVLDCEHPQLVVLNGDLITGENTFKFNSTDYVNEIVQPMLDRKLLWASTYGNHDSDFNLSRYHILEREQSWPNALTRQDVFGKEAGVSNYYLPVYSADMADTTPKLLLWFFDSRGGNYYQELDSDGNEVPQPDWVDLSVVEWFTMTRNRLRTEYGQDLPSLAFFHIPTNASLAFQQGPGVRPHYEPGINDDNPLAQQGYAGGQGTVTGNAFTYSGQDVPFMQALLSTPNLMATFSGHDHGDDWCFRWDSRLPGMTLTGNGLDMCFGRHSGYGGYGTWTRASRQVLLTEDSLKNKAPETWLRLENGDMVGRVTLNGTFSQDYYPLVPNTHT